MTFGTLEFKNFKLFIDKPKKFFFKFFNIGIEAFGGLITDPNETDNKLYMGGIPPYVSEDDVRKLCESFGIVKYFNLAKDAVGNSKGYCFFEYVEPKMTEKALKGLDSLEIGDRRIRITRASSGTNRAIEEKRNMQPSNAVKNFH